MSVDAESVVEPKFVPKVHVHFDIVDKCCIKIIKKSKTGDNWSKIFEREMCLTKMKYPFLSKKQIRGKALQQLGIPNFMGDIVRFGTHKVTGNLVKELNLVTGKKEPRIPPPFKVCQKPHARRIEKEMNKFMQTSVSLPQHSPGPQIDDNRNVTPRNSEVTDTTKHSPKRLFKFTPNFFRKRAQSGKSDIEDELGTPKKVSKMARENTTDWEGYLTSAPTEKSPLVTGDNTNKNVDEPPEKLKIECENVIYSQLSDISKRELLGNSPGSTPRGRVTREPNDDPQIFSQNLSNLMQSPRLSFTTESPANKECLSPPIFLQTQTKRRRKKKTPSKNSPHNPNVKVRNPMFRAQRNLDNQCKNNDEQEVVNAISRNIQKALLPGPNAIIHQQSSYPYFQSPSECVIPNPGSLIKSGDLIISQEVVRTENFVINPLRKENRVNFSSSNHITVPFHIPQNSGNGWGSSAHARRMLGEIQQPSNPALSPFRTENPSFPFGTQIFTFTENNTSAQIYESPNLRNTHLLQQNEDSTFQAPKSFINCPLINNILLDSDFTSSQSSVYSPVKEQSQAEYNNHLYRFHSRSIISMNSLDNEEKIPVSQLIPSNGMDITQPRISMSDNEEDGQVSSQHTKSSDIREILTSKGKTSSAKMHSRENKIDLPNEKKVSNSQLKISIGEGIFRPLSTTFLIDDQNQGVPCQPKNTPDKEKENLQSQKGIKISNDENAFRVTGMILPNMDDDSHGGNLSNAHIFLQLMSPKEMASPEEISPLQAPQFFSPNAVESPRSSAFPTQSTTSMSPLPTDNYPQNPWLNVTSQDFSHRDHSHSNSSLSQDSGQVSQDTLASPASFISTTSEESDIGVSNDRVLSLKEMLHVKVSAVKKNVERIIRWLESEN